MGMDQNPHTLWDKIVFEDGGRKRTLVVLRFSEQEMILLFIGLLSNYFISLFRDDTVIAKDFVAELTHFYVQSV